MLQNPFIDYTEADSARIISLEAHRRRQIDIQSARTAPGRFEVLAYHCETQNVRGKPTICHFSLGKAHRSEARAACSHSPASVCKNSIRLSRPVPLDELTVSTILVATCCLFGSLELWAICGSRINCECGHQAQRAAFVANSPRDQISIRGPDKLPQVRAHAGDVVTRSLGGFVRTKAIRDGYSRKRHWSFKDDRRLMELGRASKSLEEVVRETGRSPESIKKAAMRLGVSFKSQANIRRSNYAR
jgi:hypothetical protein